MNNCLSCLCWSVFSIVFKHWAGLQNDSSLTEMSIIGFQTIIGIWTFLLFSISKLDDFFQVYGNLGLCLFFLWHILPLPAFGICQVQSLLLSHSSTLLSIRPQGGILDLCLWPHLLTLCLQWYSLNLHIEHSLLSLFCSSPSTSLSIFMLPRLGILAHR